jgi:hypothetical protein
VYPFSALATVEICFRTLTLVIAPGFDLMAAITANIPLALRVNKLMPPVVASLLALHLCGDCQF